MGTNYVLGPGAARKVKALLGGAGKVTRREGAASALAFDADYPAPFAVQWAQSAKGDEGAWIIWLPGAGALVVDGATVEIKGREGADLQKVGGDYPDGWWIVDGVGADGGGIVLNVYISREGEGSDETSEGVAADAADEPDATPDATQDVRAELAGTKGEDTSDARCVSIPVAKVSRAKDSGAVETEQYVVGSVVLSVAGSPAEVDGVSIDAAGTREGEEATGSETGVLQLAHFNDATMDSGRGLAPRLIADTETGEISANGNEAIMLVARLNGKICYIPIGGDGEDPGEGKPPCDHDEGGGEGGGVRADEGGSGAGGGGGGGVAAGDDVHPGDDDCNCD